MMALVGLKDDYVHDGRVLAEWMETQALPQGIRQRREDFIELAEVYKQLNAPLGRLGRKSLVFANRSITADDTSYGRYLTKIGHITTQRDAFAGQIKSALDNAAFNHRPVGERSEDGSATRQSAD